MKKLIRKNFFNKLYLNKRYNFLRPIKHSSLIRVGNQGDGGYILDKDASEINLYQIIVAVDENIDLRRCHGLRNCLRGKQCLSHHLWCEVSDQIRDFLSTRNLQQVIDDYNENEIVKETVRIN